MNQPRPSLSLIEIPMYIGATLYILIGIGVVVFAGFLISSGEADETAAVFLLAIFGFSALVSFAFGFFFLYATSQLKHRKKWAWITAIVVGAMYTPSAFIFLGVPILIGCLNSDVNAWFNGNPSQSQHPQPPYSPQPPVKPYETRDPYQPPRQ